MREQRLGMADSPIEFEQTPVNAEVFVVKAVTDVGGRVAHWSVGPATDIDRTLLLKDPAEVLARVPVLDPKLRFTPEELKNPTDETLSLAVPLFLAKSKQVEQEITLSPKERKGLEKNKKSVLSLLGPKGRNTAAALAMLTAACSPAITPPEISPTPTLEPTPANVFEIPSQEEIVSLEVSVQAKLDETFPNIGLHETRMQGGGFLEDSLGRRYALFETLLPDPSSGFNLNLTLLSEVEEDNSISWVKGLVLDMEAQTGEFIEFLGVTYDAANNQFVVEGPLIRTSTISGDIEIYRENSWQPLLGPNETVDRVYARLGSGVLAAPALPTPTPERVEVSLEVTEVLNLLDYSSAPEIFSPENYQIKEVTFQEETYTALVHTNPDTGLERIDGMYINVDNEEYWVRGLYYQVEDKVEGGPNFGGIVLDAIFDNPEVRAGFTDSTEGPQALYDELLRAIAYQNGISYSSINKYLEENDYIVSIRLPERWVPSGTSGSRSPSLLKPSDPVTVDLKKPIIFSWRSGDYRTQGVRFSEIPENATLIFGDSRVGTVLYAEEDGGLHYINWPFEDLNVIHHNWPGYLATDMSLMLEVTARMKSGFTDSTTRGNSLIERLYVLAGADTYKPGNTIIKMEKFWTADAEHPNYTFSLISPLP